jgi:DNA polymerase III alpha subunit
MSLGEADGLRRSMSKKRDYEDFEAHRARFVGGALANGVERAVAEEIWRQIESFAGYSFCKAHSASYAQVSFQSAWLKTHYPAAFMASVLANGGGYYPAFAYVEEARRMGLDIRLPDINASAATWSAEGPPGAALAELRAIRIGLSQIGEVAAATVERILAERARAGPFASLTEFCARVSLGVAEVHRLIDTGCFDRFDLTRPQAKWKAEIAIRGWGGGAAGSGVAGYGEAREPARAGRIGGAGEGTLFPNARLAALVREAPPVPALADYPVAERRRREWDLLGVSAHHHPIEFHREAVAEARRRARASAPAIFADALARHAGRRVTIVGFLTTTKRVRTKHAEPMMFLTLEDETDIYDVVLFPRIYQRCGNRLTDRGPYVVTGRIENDPRPSSIMAERVVRLEEAES